LEKTSKIMKANCHPNPTMPAKPRPEVPHLHGLWTRSSTVRPSSAAGSPAAACRQVGRHSVL